MLVRAVLVVPIAVVLLFVTVATVVVVVIGWLAALVTGRTPAFTRDLVTGYLRLSMRAGAYGALMTDVYPDLGLDERPDDIVLLRVPEPTALNRWAVLGRVVLGFPASVVSSVISVGLVVIEVVMWFVVLASGWLPQPVHDAYRAAFRYSARVSAYLFLLVPTYPWGPFGDARTASGAVGAPGDGGAGGVAAAPTPAHAPWNTALGTGARAVLVVAVVLGIPLSAVDLFVQLGGTADYQHQQVVEANNNLVTEVDAYAHSARGCGVHIACLENNDRLLAGNLTTFADTLGQNEGAGIAVSTIERARHAAEDLAGLLYLQAQAGPTVSDYRQAVRLDRLDLAENALLRALNDLRNALNNS